VSATATAALDLHRRGLPLVPLDGKRPHADVLAAVYGSTGWDHLRERRASAPEVAAWYEHAPTANVGVIVPPGLAVVDVDRPELLREHHPPTPCVQTARGRHLWFRGDVAGVERRPWGELRGAGSIVVAPPSVHPDTGERYGWAVGLDDARPAPLPSWASASADQGSAPRQYVLPRSTCGAVGDPAHDAQAVAAVLAHLGRAGVQLDAKRGRSRNLRCLLPEHDDRRASAGVYRSASGAWRYRCHGCGVNVSLPMLFASVTGGRTLSADELPAPSATRWAARMWHAAGVAPVELPELPELPAGVSATARRVAAGFAQLVALRSAAGDTDPAPYTWGFASAWCGVSRDQAKRALRELRAAGWLVPTGPSRPGHGFLYQPPAVLPSAVDRSTRA
jgi:hypothetical protein